MGLPGWLYFGSAEEGRHARPLVDLSQFPYFQNRGAHIIFVLGAPRVNIGKDREKDDHAPR